MNVAIGFADFGNPDQILHKSHGELVFRAYEWDESGVTQNIIPSHPCTYEELGLNVDKQDESAFFPIENS